MNTARSMKTNHNFNIADAVLAPFFFQYYIILVGFEHDFTNRVIFYVPKAIFFVIVSALIFTDLKIYNNVLKSSSDSYKKHVLTLGYNISA